MISVTQILFFGVLAVLCVGWYRISRKFILGKKIPGPKHLPILGSALYIAIRINRLAHTLFELCDGYDGLFKFNIFHQLYVVISKPEHFQTLFTNTSNSLDKPEHYLATSELTGKKNIFVANGEDWKKARKLFVTTVNQNPEHQLSTFTYAKNKLISDLREKANGETFPVGLVLRSAALKIAWGNIFGELGQAETIGEEIAEKLIEIEHDSIIRAYIPPLLNTSVFKLFPQSRKYFQNVDFIRGNMRNALLEKIKDFENLKKNNQALPNNFFYNHLEKYPIENMEDLVEEYIILLQTTVVTTPVALGYALLCLGMFPEHQDKILEEYNEIKNILGREPENNDVHMYQYLDRFLKESMRIFPLFGILGRVLPGDIKFGKYTVPKDTIVILCNLSMCHDASVFPHPTKFDTDRFLPENVEKRHPFAYLPFMAGPRGCPGKSYAYSMMKLLLPIIVQEFKIVTHYKSVEEVLGNARFRVASTDEQSFPIKLIPRQ